MPAKRASVAFDPLDTPFPPPKRARLSSPKVVIPPPLSFPCDVPIKVNKTNVASPKVMVSPPPKPTPQLAKPLAAAKVRVATPFHPSIPDPRPHTHHSTGDGVSDVVPELQTGGPTYSKTFTNFLRKHGPEAVKQADQRDAQREADHKYRSERSRRQAQEAEQVHFDEAKAEGKAALQTERNRNLKYHQQDSQPNSSSARERKEQKERIEAWNAKVIEETGAAAAAERNARAVLRGRASRAG